ncbi:MAG: sulfurtransferase TusA family protein [Deltaproteobacteria bacterium]|nr:sulfurtransferase TusA family protein [Deltaproteobacteria bacterium]
MQGDLILDCKGLSCPMPILKLAMAIKKLDVGKVIEMHGTDPGSKDDVPAWCEKTGNTLLEIVEVEDGFTFFIRRDK